MAVALRKQAKDEAVRGKGDLSSVIRKPHTTIGGKRKMTIWTVLRFHWLGKCALVFLF